MFIFSWLPWTAASSWAISDLSHTCSDMEHGLFNLYTYSYKLKKKWKEG